MSTTITIPTVSRKLVAAMLANVLTFAIAFAVQKYAIHESALVATEIASLVGWVSAGVAGWLAKEIPQFVQVEQVPAPAAPDQKDRK